MSEVNVYEDFENKIAKARASLYKTAPYFARLCMYLKPIFVDDKFGVPVTAVDRKGNLFVNINSVPKWSNKDTQFFLAHELLHLYTKCFQREPENVVHQVWNIANDIVINRMIVNDLSGLGINLPNPEVITPLYEGFDKYDNWTTEEVYKDLMNNSKKISSSNWCCDSASRCGKDSDSEGNGGDKEDSNKTPGNSPISGTNNSDETSQWKMRFQREFANGKQAGNLPGCFEEFLAALGSAKLNWKRILARTVSPTLKKNYNWRKVNRRTAQSVRTPGMDKVLPDAICYLDTSGSMSNDNLNEALTEFNEIMKVSGGKGWLILGDTEAYFFDRISAQSLSHIRVKRGGTDFRPIFEMIEKNKIKPKIFVGFTDLEGPFPETIPNFPVLWCRVSGGRAIAPFGKVIDVNF